MKKLNVHPVEDKCPLCGSSDIEFGTAEIDDAGVSFECECKECGATFTECYNMVFAGDWNVVDKDGNEYEDLQV